MRLAPLCAAVLFVAVVGAAAQVAPQRDGPAAGSQAPQIGTASVAGSVTVMGSGAPARGARVQLSAMPSNPSGPVTRATRTATTDEHGRFTFAALPAGRYTLTASKPGHVTISYGQHQPGAGRPGTSIQLAEGQKFEALLQMPRGSVLTGTVLNELGEATPGTSVRALRYGIQNGQRTLLSAGTGSTDDRGVYRIFGLQPGEYVVCAMPRPTPGVVINTEQMQAEMTALQQASVRLEAVQAAEVMARAQALERELAAHSGEEQRTGYATVCYPGTTMPTSAVAIPLGAGQERSGLDFQLQLVPVGTVEGTVVSPAGGATQNVQITLTPAGPGLPGVGTSSTRAGNDGRFRLNNVTPGQYRLTARGTTPSAPVTARPAGTTAPPQRVETPRLWAQADIVVDGRNVTDVVLPLMPALTVTGQITFSGAGAPPQDLSRARVTLTPAPLGGTPVPGGSSASATADASGRFTIPNIVPGQYRLSASGLAGWMVESSVLAGQESMDFPVTIAPGSNLTGAIVTMTDRQSEISGVITDGRGQPVPDYTLIIFPADSRYWTPMARRIQTARPGTDGHFTFRSLPPGDYRIATVLDPEPGSWTDPSYLSELEGVSLRVSISEGEKKVQNIRLAGQ
jgi:protocatechuate 3,4-dioxygenase beta subunit